MDETLYDTDIVAWSDAQAEALRAHDWDALDITRLIEELEAVKERYVSDQWSREPESLAILFWSKPLVLLRPWSTSITPCGRSDVI